MSLSSSSSMRYNKSEGDGASTQNTRGSSVGGGGGSLKSRIDSASASVGTSGGGGGGGIATSQQPSTAAPFSWAQEEYVVPLNDVQCRQRRRPSNSSTINDDDDEDDNNNFDKERRPSSFQQWLTSGTLGFLKMAGGVTLTTTGKLVAPPLHITKTVLIPNLLAAVIDYVDGMTGQRTKDWIRIVTTSFHHLFKVLINTSKGQVFRHKIIHVWSDFLDCLSSDDSRQVFMDGMSCVVKLTEALHTPEVRLLLEQLSVLGCRLVDAASSGKNKQLIHDSFDLCWSGIEVVADPATTLALAEVTAYLCHALEIQDASTLSDDKTTRAERRYERNKQQHATYASRQLLNDPDSTVEEVILSSLGGGHGDYGIDVVSDDNVDASSIPSNVVVDDDTGIPSLSLHGSGVPGGDFSEDASSPSDWKDHARNEVNISYLRDKIGQRAKSIDQRQRINRTTGATTTTTTTATAAAASSSLPNLQDPTTNTKTPKKGMETPSSIASPVDNTTTTQNNDDNNNNDNDNDDKQKKKNSQKIKNPIKGDIEDLITETPKTKPKKSRLDRVRPQGDEQDSSKSVRLENETPLAHFYRVLDQVLVEKRKESVIEALQTLHEKSQKAGRLLRPTHLMGTAAAAKNVKDTVRSRLFEFRSKSKKAAQDLISHHKSSNKNLRKVWKEHQAILVCGVIMVLLVGTTFTSFALYGMYRYIYPQTILVPSKAATSSSSSSYHTAMGQSSIQHPSQHYYNKNLHTSLHHDPHASPNQQTSPPSLNRHNNEIVIRVIKEVVHVTEDGQILDRQTSPVILGDDEIDEMTKYIYSVA